MSQDRLSEIFWEAHREYRYSTVEISLYFYLLGIREDGIARVRNPKIQADLSITAAQLKYARGRLKQSGMIEFDIPGEYRIRMPEGRRRS